MIGRRWHVVLCATVLSALLSGCVVMTVASTAVSVAGTAVGVGLTVASTAVDVAAAGVRGAANVMSDDDE